MKILHLTLKKKWFDMIASGEKKEEYREIKDFWSIRLSGYSLAHGIKKVSQNFKPFDRIVFTNGYAKDSPKVTIEFKGIELGMGKSEWGANPSLEYFVIKLGKIVK